MTKFVVVGGGLTGLSSALFLKLKNKNNSVILIEASKRLGGWIKSKSFDDGSVHELGPRTIRMQSPTIKYLLKVIENINVTDKIISISKKDKTFHKRYLYAHNQMHLLDFNLLKPAQKPFSESLFSQIFKSALQKFKHGNNFQDLSFDSFVRTRFGSEIADYIINPVIRGIYACDSKDISTKSTFPTLVEFEKLGPNVVIGSIKYYFKNLFKFEETKEIFLSKAFSKKLNELSVISFRNGLETMILELRNKILDLDVDIQTCNPVLSLGLADSNKLIINLNDTSIKCDKIILAVPSFVSSSLLQDILPNHDLLNNIHWNNVAVVVLEYRGRLISQSGFGHLIPSWEIPETLGVIYDSCILPENDSLSEVTTRYTVMLGGAWFYPIIDKLNSFELVDKAKNVLKIQLGIDGDLVRSTVSVNYNCIPVYGLKHKDIVSTIRKSIDDRHLPIQLCGNSYDGVSLSDCVYSAHKAVEALSQ